MDPVPEYSLFLVRILEELDAKYSSVSYQDLCKSLCARFDLVHLAKLRSLLFYTACLDPSFPATLFKDKMRCSVDDQQSKKLMVAADIVTMFNLIQMNGGTAKDKLPMGPRPKFHKNQSFESCRSDTDVYKYSHSDRAYDLLEAQGHPTLQVSPRPESGCNSCQHFIPTSDPNFLLGVSKDMKCRAASLDKLQHLPQYSRGSSPPCEMQSTYFPMEIDSESTTDQDSLHLNPGIKETFISNAEPFTVHSCVQKRNIFKEDFHNLVAFAPQVLTTESNPSVKVNEDYQRKEPHKPTAFFNHSFELPYSNPYFEPVGSPVQDKRRVKHESLDNLQASTYFGPTTVTECVNTRKTSGKQSKQPHWPIKSLSLNTEEGPDFERSFLGGQKFKDGHRRNVNNMDNEQHYQGAKEKQPVTPSGFCVKSNGPKMKDTGSMASGAAADRREVKRLKDKSINCTSFQAGNVDSTLSVGTQTEQLDQRKRKEFAGHGKYGEKQPFKLSDEDSEIVSDDISDIFRFLDDMSVCGSTGVIQSSCYNSNGSLSQVTKSDGDSTPEHNTIKLGKGANKLDRLFHSLESSDDELKASVCKLVLRIGEIEKKLESLSGVRGEISQVLSKLNRLDEKIQEPEASGRTKDGNVANLHPPVFQCHTTGHAVKVDGSPEWCCSDAGGSSNDGLRVKALRRSFFTRRSSRSLTEENSATESKVASISNSLRDWRAVSYSSHPGDDGKEKDGKDRQRKSKEGQESLNPNNLEYWMEDIYTPGYDSLLKRKEAEFRRAKVCKIGALIAAAACTVILVIVVPICTMKS
ncbi:major intrinsically disordered Notch2-binding receptor 1 isoform X2 [Brienomyrus brachyistius]|uniref:major intrinsically disordered Notch2-binding receptor 1 isoform X2 n=1 Tax=Brienomyrus brachyistius TaxID=42636 RepID=UPI0020B19BEA|nr:major intrinsically disordered Notch2-binding receptor 1 isoform X2 [Brienomyrus brachyistius]